MTVKGLTDEDFVNYKSPSMFVATCYCSFKCDKESGVRCCQNSALAAAPSKTLDDDFIIRRYLSNPITKAIVFGGLEPINQFDEMLTLIKKARKEYHCLDPIVVYTGYNPDEIKAEVMALKHFPPVVIKYGRFVPDDKPRYDPVLGVTLSSSNQFAEEYT